MPVPEIAAPLDKPAQDSGSGSLQMGSVGGVDVEYRIRDGLAIVEGDIVLGPAHEIQPPTGGKDREKSAIGITALALKWTSGKIPYSIDYTIPDQGRITRAMSVWNNSLGGAVRLSSARTRLCTFESFVAADAPRISEWRGRMC